MVVLPLAKKIGHSQSCVRRRSYLDSFTIKDMVGVEVGNGVPV